MSADIVTLAAVYDIPMPSAFRLKLKQPKQKGIKNFSSNKSIERKQSTAYELIKSVKIKILVQEDKLNPNWSQCYNQIPIGYICVQPLQ